MGALQLAQSLSEKEDPRLSAWSDHFLGTVAKESLQLAIFLGRMGRDERDSYENALLEILAALPAAMKVGVSGAVLDELRTHLHSDEIAASLREKVFVQAIS